MSTMLSTYSTSVSTAVSVIALILLCCPCGCTAAESAHRQHDGRVNQIRVFNGKRGDDETQFSLVSSKTSSFNEKDRLRLESDRLLSGLYDTGGSYLLSLDEIASFSGIEHEEESDNFMVEPPFVRTDQMAEALLMTAELNHRLVVGSTATIIPTIEPRRTSASAPLLSFVSTGASASPFDHLRGGGRALATKAPFRIPSDDARHQQEYSSDETATNTFVFHILDCDKQSRQWKADFHHFLDQLLGEIVGESDDTTSSSCDASSLERTLAMIYLDRACSVDTPRSFLYSKRLPFCTPRSVHGLTLAAVLLAVNAVRGDSVDMNVIYARVHQTFGISRDTCLTMEQGMRNALGDSGIYVTPDELLQWKRQWEVRFG
jgi:hypothetical protein